MLFHTPIFGIFFTIFLVFYFLSFDRKGRMLVLLAFSNVFYGWWSWKYLMLLWLTILVDYVVARALDAQADPRRRKWLVSISVASNLTVLGVFKYYNFFIDSLHMAGIPILNGWTISNIVIPAGLSFYTFQSISYTVDVYRKRQQAVRSLLDYAAFVCYFPQLVAGPIERASHLLPMLAHPARPDRARISQGVLLFCLGFYRKSIADIVSQMVDPVFANMHAAEPLAVVLAIFGFGIQIYLDFSGYTDMARGISKVMGVDLMINFRAPYLSRSPQEFWHRWHISLSQWLRDYLYIPLGGNRSGRFHHYRNLMLTMVLGGLWHGAGAGFIIWGALHGIYLCVHELLKKSKFILIPTHWPVRLAVNAVAWFATWIAMNYAWLYFRAPTLSVASAANGKIWAWLKNPVLPSIPPGFAMVMLSIVLIDFWIRDADALQARISRIPPIAMDAVSGVLFLFGFCFMVGAPAQQFIYLSF